MTLPNASPDAFPPRMSSLPALILGSAAGVGLAVTVSAQPLSIVGHGLSAGMLIQLAVEWWRLRCVSAELPSTAETGLTGWAERLARDCLGSEPARLTDQDARHRLAECRDDLCRTLDLRWWGYFGVAAGIAVLGLASGLSTLRSAPTGGLLLDYREVFLPLTVATVEAVVIGLVAFFLRLEWEELLERWRELASAAGRRLPVLSIEPARVSPGGVPAGGRSEVGVHSIGSAGRKRGRLTFRKSVAVPTAPPIVPTAEPAPISLSGGLTDPPSLSAEPEPEPAPPEPPPPVVRLVPRLEDDD